MMMISILINSLRIVVGHSLEFILAEDLFMYEGDNQFFVSEARREYRLN